ncbi:hypothetical protein CQA66_05895 [Helicobacter aurati]|uniref:Autotransporter outer membrane beta-barrel domain-containing protein n=1 Tax=Helicobacter aurati TaxID=137778 RepID=A0A3D8J3A9_9HELI|nr:hypothetical protein [Helicobacter aurati]RDU71635.1 hypothetical protein CQA66_05895 [Helicobacter aurati]
MKKYIMILATLLVAAHADSEITYNEDSKKHDISLHKTIETENINPTFQRLNGIFENKNFGDLSASYFAIFSLSDSQILGINGMNINYEYLHNFAKMQMKIHGNTALGFVSSSLSSQSNSRKPLFLSALVGKEISIPLNFTPLSFFIIGTDIGFSKLDRLSLYLYVQYIGVDFPYKSYVFRPFLKAQIYTANADALTTRGASIALGLRASAFFKNGSAFIETSIQRNIPQNNHVTIVLPTLQSSTLQGISTAIDVKAGAEIVNAKWMKMRGDAGVLYTWDYYNINTYIKLSALLTL